MREAWRSFKKEVLGYALSFKKEVLEECRKEVYA